MRTSYKVAVAVLTLLAASFWGFLAAVYGPRLQQQQQAPKRKIHRHSQGVSAPEIWEDLELLRGLRCPEADAHCRIHQTNVLKHTIGLGFRYPQLWRTWGDDARGSGEGGQQPLRGWGGGAGGEGKGKGQQQPHEPLYGRWAFEPALPRSAKAVADKWIVITSVQLPTDAVAQWAGLPGWKVVVVSAAHTMVVL